MDMIYWPAIYISLASVLLLNPLHMCYYHTRMWLLGVLWRLCFSGLYPVEFKDFWLGDLLCSQTYALGVGFDHSDPVIYTDRLSRIFHSSSAFTSMGGNSRRNAIPITPV